MDFKRKVNGGGTMDQDDADRAAKRRKLPVNGDLSQGQTPETTTYYGLILLNQLRTGLDKQGRPFATNFLTLPDRKEFAAYYAVTKMPIAFDTIQEKLDNHDFATLSELECFFKRLVKNAKDYNERESIIHRDAERIRKAVVKFMTDNNPEYKTNPGMKLEPTPIPPVESIEYKVDPKPAAPAPVHTAQDDSDADAEGEPEYFEEETKTEPQPIVKRRGRPPKNPGAPRKSTTPAVSDSHYASVSFTGLTFQQAQEKVIADVLSHKVDPSDDFFEFEPFVALPPRSLKDYYHVIPNPHCLKDLQKRVKGTYGGKNATGVSDFKSWAALEEDASLIWKNAYHYNEDGSEIFVLAKDLETFFKKELEKARKAVPEPVTPKIKLNVKASEPTPKITLRVGVGSGGRAADSPAPLTSGSNGTATSGTSSNGEPRRNPFGGSHSTATPAPNLGQLERARSMSNSAASPSPSAAVPVKSEDALRKSPTTSIQTTQRPIGQAVSTPTPSTMLPPHTPSTANNNTYNQGGYAQSFNHQPANIGLESKFRAPGKDASHAMITNLSIATHPRLNVSRHFHMDLPPSATLTQQSITINLPSTHYYLQIKPTIAQSLLERQYKIFVTSGVTRLHAIPLIPNHGVDPRQPLFEARLLPGVNKIEVELIAALPKGTAKPAGEPDVEIEKVTVFANLMRN